MKTIEVVAVMMKSITVALSVLMICGCAHEPFESVVFKAGEEGYDTYRIPALVSAPDGTLLAFAEGRRNGAGDAGNIDLIMKRSTDDGKTWGPIEMVWDDADNTCGNPAPVFDESTGRLLLMMTWNLGSDTESMINTGRSADTRRVFLTYSDDMGRSWSEPRELTSQLKNPSWTWFATGPCHALVKKHAPHKGRIIVPCNYNDAPVDGGAGPSYSFAVYSDDGGETWHAGTSAETGGNESTVAELNDGSLLLNMRNWSRAGDKTLRRLALSRDGGTSWSETFYADSLYEPICQGSMLSRKGTLLFSNPHSGKGRTDMTISTCRDGGKTWYPTLPIHSGMSAYSDLTTLSNGDIGLLYEYGDDSRSYTGIRFRYVGWKEIKHMN